MGNRFWYIGRIGIRLRNKNTPTAEDGFNMVKGNWFADIDKDANGVPAIQIDAYNRNVIEGNIFAGAILQGNLHTYDVQELNADYNLIANNITKQGFSTVGTNTLVVDNV